MAAAPFNSSLVQKALTRIESVLRRHGFVYQANLAEIAAATLARDPAAACALLQADEWWGDRDSIAAIDLGVVGGFTPEARCDGQALREALVEVFRELRRVCGDLSDDHMDLVARHFHKWSVSGV
jgi:hypothetical protein